MLHVSECNGKLKFVATLVECLPTTHYLASYSHANFKHKTLNAKELFKKVADIGVNQHFAIVSGNCLEKIEMLAKLIDADCYVIE
jgi:L-arabinose isomerase